MKRRKASAAIVGTIFFVVVVVSIIGYALYSTGLIDDLTKSVDIKQILDFEKDIEEFEITSVRIDNNKFNITIQNHGKLPIDISRIWIENPNSLSEIPIRYDTSTIIPSGQSIQDIGQNIAFTAMESESYMITLVTERGKTEQVFLNAVDRGSLDIKLYALPTTVTTGLETTIMLEATNVGSTNLLNIQAEMNSVTTPVCVDCSYTLVSGPNPPFIDSLEPGGAAVFEWVYEISGEPDDQIQFNASLVNGINQVSETVTVTQIQTSEAGSVIVAGAVTAPLDDNVLVWHEETYSTPDGVYQMFSGAPDGIKNDLLLHFDSSSLDSSFYTKNSTTQIVIPAGVWTASLQIQSEAMPPILEGDGEDMIFHFEDGDGNDPDNSEGDSSRDLESCGTPFVQEISAGNNDAEEDTNDGDVTTSDSDLEMLDDGGTNQIIGIRFTGVTIPQGATVHSATVQFTADESDSSNVDLTIWGESGNNVPAFTTSNSNISNRNKTTTSVAWNNIPAWSTGEQGPDTTTPDLSTIVQEIVNRADWNSGENLVFIIEGNTTNERVAESVEGGPDAPTITISYGDATPDWQSGSGPHGSGSYYFDGNDDCFRSQNNISSADGNHLSGEPDTTSLWFKTDGSVTSEQYLVYWEGDGTCPNCDYLKIALDNTGRILYEFKTSNSAGQDIVTCLSTNDYDKSEWYHIVAVRGTGSNECELYITNLDGTDSEAMINDDNNYSTDQVDADGKWYVASNKQENGNFFKGWIDDIIHWNDKSLTSFEADDISHTNYGTGAHRFDFWIDLTDSNGVTVSNIHNEADTEIAFQDPKIWGDNDDAGYGVFNVTFNLPQTTVAIGQRLNFSMHYVQSTSTWEALDMDMKVDDENIIPLPSFLEIPMPDNPFPSYFRFDNDDEMEIYVTNLGPNGIYFTNAGTRIALNGTNGGFVGQIHTINGTDATFAILPEQDSIYIPAGARAHMYFYQATGQPSDDTLTYDSLIPAGTYDATIWLVGYDDQGESFTRSINIGNVEVID